MLCAGIDNRHRHLDRSEQGRYPFELVVAEPFDVVDGVVDGVVAFVAGCVSRLAVSRDVEHHQPLFGDGRLHAGRLSDECDVNLRQQGQNALYAAFSAHFLFGAGQEDEVVEASAFFEKGEDMQERDQAGTVVVGSEAVDAASFASGAERVALPSAYGLHRVDVCVQQQRLFRGVEPRLYRPDVVAHSLYLKAEFALHIVLQEVGSRLLLPAYARHLDEPTQQPHRFLSHH